MNPLLLWLLVRWARSDLREAERNLRRLDREAERLGNRLNELGEEREALEDLVRRFQIQLRKLGEESA